MMLLNKLNVFWEILNYLKLFSLSSTSVVLRAAMKITSIIQVIKQSGILQQRNQMIKNSSFHDRDKPKKLTTK